MTNISISQIKDQIRTGQTKSTEITASVLKRIEQHNPSIGAYLSVFADKAIQQAGEVDKKIAAGLPVGALAGIPIAVKDNMCYSEGKTTCGSKILGNFKPPYNAHVVEKLLASDAIILGKTNMDEFAMGSSTENSGLQKTVNPWDTSRVPGGSSGGSAAAMAAGLCRSIRFRHRRFDPPASQSLRHRRAETHLRPCLTLWPGRLWLQPRPDWAINQLHRRCRPAAGRYRRA
jgi:aspartyl-tRNA(Asn)/glutamyl-tRNA(Gln) amidotransferase subunit A